MYVWTDASASRPECSARLPIFPGHAHFLLCSASKEWLQRLDCPCEAQPELLGMTWQGKGEEGFFFARCLAFFCHLFFFVAAVQKMLSSRPMQDF